jgi:O-antigen ligase
VALKRWIKSLGDYAIVLILLTEPDSGRAIKQVLARVAFLLMPFSILFIKYYPSLGRAYASHWDSTQFYVGVSDNKNMLGMVCMVFGFAAFARVLEAWQGLQQERIRALLVHGSVLAMAVWLLRISDSKTSLACFVLACGLVAAHAFSKVARRRIVTHVMVVASVLICFCVLFLGVGSGALENLGRNATLTGRTDIWRILLDVPVNPVVGTGFESFWLGKRMDYLWSFQIVNGLNEAHNGYLEMYLNLGWGGVALLFTLFWAGYQNVLRLLVRDPAAGRLRLGYFLIAIVYDFTEAGIRTSDLIWIALLFVVITLPKRPLSRVPASDANTGFVETNGVLQQCKSSTAELRYGWNKILQQKRTAVERG